MDNLLEFLFNESETEEYSTPVLGVNHVMNLEDLEELYPDEES